MIKLNRLKDITLQTIIEACNTDIKKEPLKHNLTQDNDNLGLHANIYKHNTFPMKLHLIKGIKRSDTDLVTNNLTKGDLNKLYTYYFSQKPSGKQIRYRILSNAKKCPFCSLSHNPKTLDHFLPKTLFPQFSILPENLVPACKECNEEFKKTFYADVEDEQILHPYFDDIKFYNTQWIKAKYIPSHKDEPCIVEFYVSPPNNWSDTDKKRVQKHFDLFQIKERYSYFAMDAVGVIEEQLKRCKNEPIETILNPIIEKHHNRNDWERVLCLEIKEVLST